MRRGRGSGWRRGRGGGKNRFRKEKAEVFGEYVVSLCFRVC